MRAHLVAAVALATAAGVSATALAQDASPKGPPKTMGEEGKLPATGTMTGRTPEMGGTGAGPEAGSGAGSGGSSSTKGPSVRMGDDGKLPATGTMSGATPKMNPPAEPGK